jgi:hypothetical protein
MGQAKKRQAEIAALKAMPKDTTGLLNNRLYHGTTETVARLIIDNGGTLQPRGTERESLYPTMPSRCDCVYLTDFYGVKYALDAVWGELKQRGIREWILAGAVVEIDMGKLSPSNLVPDEDFLAKMHIAKHGLDGESRFQELAYNYARQDANRLKPAALECLRCYGTVAYHGEIPRSSITRIAIMSALRLAALRRDHPDDELWEIHPNQDPRTFTNTERLQQAITRSVFDIPNPDIQIKGLSKGKI